MFLNHIFISAFTSLIGEKVREGERSLPYSFIASGGQVGLLLVGSAGSYIGVQYKWDYLFQLIGFLSLIWVYVLHQMDKNYKLQNSNLHKNATDSGPNDSVKPNLCKRAVLGNWSQFF